MNTPSKWTDFVNKVPGWLKAAFGLIGAIAAFIVAFRDNWRLYTTVTVVLILVYIFVINLYILLARRKTRSKKNQSIYRFGKYRYLGLIGMVITCLLFAGLAAAGPTRQIARDGILGIPTPTPTSTPFPTPTPLPTQTLVPTPTPPQLASPDVVIARFDGSQATFTLDVAGQLEGNLSRYLRANGLPDVNLQVRDDLTVASELEAQNVVNLTESKVVIWGKFDNTYIQVRVFLSGGEQGGTEVPGTEQIGLASSDPSGELAFKVQGVITDNLLFLAPFVLGYLQYHSNNYEAGHQAFDVAMDNIPTNVEIENEAIVHFFRARKMARTTLDAQAFEEVVCEYKQAILEDPGFDVAYNNLGLVISRLYGEKPPFRDKPSIDMSPGAVTCLQEIQQQGLIVGDYQDPKTYFQRALAVNGNLTLAKFNLYAFKWMQSPGPEALPGILSEIEKIQQADDSIVGTYIILGVAKERGGDAAGAIKMYQLGIKQMENPGRINPADPKLALMRFNLGQLFSQQEDWSAAETEFKQIVDSNPRDYGAIRVLGNLYYRQGKFSEAALHLDAILTTSDSSDPGMPFYKSTAFILRSGGEYKQGGISSAINYLNQAAQTTPRDPYPHFLLGLLYQAQGSNDLAIASFNKSNELDTPPEPAPWSTFKDQCLRDTEVDANSFANWAMDKLPSSPCLGRNLSDPNERIITFYNMLSDLLLQGRELPSFGMTSAQCPYVYTADPVTGNWEFDTTIMYKIVDREAAQMRPLTQFNGRLLIREQEPEISYINRLYVLAKMSDGSYQLLEPDVEDLKHSDDDYIVLHQGDEILVSLDGYPVTGDVSQWWVMAVGYYTPLGK